MKKILIAICVISSTIGFCNNLKNNVENVECIEFQKEKQYLPCTEMWKNDVDCLMIDYCATFEEACVIADRAFEECLDIMYGD